MPAVLGSLGRLKRLCHEAGKGPAPAPARAAKGRPQNFPGKEGRRSHRSRLRTAADCRKAKWKALNHKKVSAYDQSRSRGICRGMCWRARPSSEALTKVAVILFYGILKFIMLLYWTPKRTIKHYIKTAIILL